MSNIINFLAKKRDRIKANRVLYINNITGKISDNSNQEMIKTLKQKLNKVNKLMDELKK